MISKNFYKPLWFKKLIIPILSKTNLIPLRVQINFDILDYPYYAYGIYKSAQQAKKLGHDAISVIEFGVAGGNGLVAMEKIALLVEKEFDIRVDVYGFDIGTGLPSPSDYRDLPYVWKKGFYKMDIEKLQSRITKAKLILGDVNKTVDVFISSNQIAPIGFVSFDLDFYSSTKEAFRLFSSDNDENYLPRIFTYFDDVISNNNAYHNDYQGELLAIKEYNEESKESKIAPIHGLAHSRIYKTPWNDQMFIHHIFTHQYYNIYLDRDDKQLPLN